MIVINFSFAWLKYVESMFSIKKQLLHFLKFVELFISQAFWTVCLIAINAEIGVLVTSNDSLASEAFAGGVLCVLNNHLTILDSEQLLNEDSHLVLLNGSTLVLIDLNENLVEGGLVEPVRISKVSESLQDESLRLGS